MGSYGRCCGGVRACVSDAAACCGVRRCITSAPVVCGARRGQIRAPPGLGWLLRAPPARSTVSGGVHFQWGSFPHWLLLTTRHAPVAAGAPNFAGITFSGARYDRAAPTGRQTGRRGRIFFCVGMGGMGEGGRVRKMGRGGHGRRQERARWVRMKGREMNDMGRGF